MSKKCTPLWREAHFQVKMYKATPWSDHLWKLRCRKSARHCGAKHISKSKCTKHTMVGPLVEVQMSKKCTPLWREAHFQVKMYKTTPWSDHLWKFRCRKSARRCGAKHISKSKCTKPHHGRTTCGSSDVEKVHAVAARSTFPSQTVQSTLVPDHFLEVEMSKKCTPLSREAHFQVKMYKTPRVWITFRGSDVASLHSTTLNYITPHYITRMTLHHR